MDSDEIISVLNIHEPSMKLDNNEDNNDISTSSLKEYDKQLDPSWSYEIHSSSPLDQRINNQYQYITSEERDRERRSREYEHSIEDEDISVMEESQPNGVYNDDLEDFQSTTIPTVVPLNSIPSNSLNPRQQEEADQPVREGMRYLFDNKFMRAKAIFQINAASDPLYALGLGAMAFIRAIMTHRNKDIQKALKILNTTYFIAKAQIDNTNKKRTVPLMQSFTRYFGEQSNINNTTSKDAQKKTFLINSILRANVIKAEASLLMGILLLTQESLMSYVKCGFHFRRAYYSYNLVWQEYKRMGQDYTKYMDRDTVSGIQFGIGAVQLLLSSMPSKLDQINSLLGWSYDKELGFVLLKLCTEARGIRSSLSSLVLLAYYNILTSFAPQLYGKECMEPALKCLTDAQNQHPRSCFFLYFAARFARAARNLTLSSQSFRFATEASRGEWAELAMQPLSDYEQAFNDALQLNWEDSLATFTDLGQQGYWSPAFSKYMVGACYEMLGRRTEAILAFAEVPQLIQRTMAEAGVSTYSQNDNIIDNGNSSKSTRGILYVDTFIQKRVKRYQQGGYQHMDLHLPALEMLLMWNVYEWMEKDALTHCLTLVHHALSLVYERERVEYGIRQKKLVPSTAPPNYYDKRAGLLLIKATVLNGLRQSQEAVAHLNWILDHKRHFKYDSWIVPFTYWESGVTCWHLGQYEKSRRLWQQALAYTDYDFEHRLTIRLSLALNKCDDLGIHLNSITKGGISSNGRKRMPLA
ncbi:uncharacterized protein BX664DRAFT_321998 [Halteromyces radiatus]|uniref:uncharacterized protein n=1 Tax=Halteromyces radiatus TaxID=101107 RepID=UPI00222082E8|nr:uncharacterized protein BX664DRAFT_321998 [Halteromyces radiatus]KAI8099731.1 hypothetical protein BX664DRAFT_321998 [Halteromyces radiatus]